MNWRWEESGGWWTRTASPHFVRGRQYVGLYARLRGRDRSLIKGQKYTLLSHRDNLTLGRLGRCGLGLVYLLEQRYFIGEARGSAGDEVG